MNSIEKLIEELCPEGVEFREIQELFEIRNGYTPSTSNKSYWTNGTVPWFRMEDIRGNGRILDDSIRKISAEAVKGGNTFPANSIIVATSATIGEYALITVPHLSNQRFTSMSLKPAFVPALDMKFVFYYCFLLGKWCTKNTSASSFASVNMSSFRKFKFPIPPLEIQNKIVNILDSFTELEARRRQYAYYRNTLLAFEASKLEDAMVWEKLESVGRLYAGLSGKAKSDFLSGNANFISYINVFKNIDADLCAEDRVFIKEGEKQNTIQLGDILFTGSSEVPEEVGMSSVVTQEPTQRTYLNSFCFGFRLNDSNLLHPGFSKHLFRSSSIRQQIIGTANGVTRFNISKERFKKIKIPIPPLAEQIRIAAILD